MYFTLISIVWLINKNIAEPLTIRQLNPEILSHFYLQEDFIAVHKHFGLFILHDHVRLE